MRILYRQRKRELDLVLENATSETGNPTAARQSEIALKRAEGANACRATSHSFERHSSVWVYVRQEAGQ